eukprot:COSAG06_NODE_28715_length_569_cov_1.387234_1_plen_32_part_10
MTFKKYIGYTAGHDARFGCSLEIRLGVHVVVV